MKRKSEKISEALCVVCQKTKSNVVHCAACCGWGITGGLKAHKFRASRRRAK